MTDTDESMRELTKRLFTDPDAPAPVEVPAPDPSRGNVAPKEGGNADAPKIGANGTDLRGFTRRLFGRDDD